jgi:hypothetical protein
MTRKNKEEFKMAKEYMMNWEEYRKYNNSGIYLIAV